MMQFSCNAHQNYRILVSVIVLLMCMFTAMNHNQVMHKMTRLVALHCGSQLLGADRPCSGMPHMRLDLAAGLQNRRSRAQAEARAADIAQQVLGSGSAGITLAYRVCILIHVRQKHPSLSAYTLLLGAYSATAPT